MPSRDKVFLFGTGWVGAWFIGKVRRPYNCLEYWRHGWLYWIAVRIIMFCAALPCEGLIKFKAIDRPMSSSENVLIFNPAMSVEYGLTRFKVVDRSLIRISKMGIGTFSSNDVCRVVSTIWGEQTNTFILRYGGIEMGSSLQNYFHIADHFEVLSESPPRVRSKRMDNELLVRLGNSIDTAQVPSNPSKSL